MKMIKQVREMILNHLAEVILLHEGENEPDKAKDIEGKGYQTMVAHKEWEKINL